MDIQNLVRERVIGNIKIGMKGENGIPKKLSYFNVENDKGTGMEMVDIFKQLYPGKPTELKIQFTSENPFNFKYKRYVNGKAVCIGNGEKAITIGKDSKNNNTQIEVECGGDCEHRRSGKCKLKGSLKFVLDGIDAGGVWNLSTSCGISLSNIASEIVSHRKAGKSIVGLPFKLTLTEQESIGYGNYYSINLKRADIKPQITNETMPKLIQSIDETNVQEIKQLSETTKKENENTSKTNDKENIKNKKEKGKEIIFEEKQNDGFSNYFVIKTFMPTLINGTKFTKIIFEDMHSQDVEYILHPKANPEIINCSVGTIIEIIESKMEIDKNILCKYVVKQIMNPDGSLTDVNNNEELKKAV